MNHDDEAHFKVQHSKSGHVWLVESLQLDLTKRCGSARLFSCPTPCMCLYFCCVSVLGRAPADLLLLTASTSALPDLAETVIVSASVLNGSAGWFQATQLVHVYLFFCQLPHFFGPTARHGVSIIGVLSFSAYYLRIRLWLLWITL